MGDYKQEFLDLLEGLSPEEWNMKINKKWRVKDVVSHLVGWEEEFAVCLMDSWQNGESPWFIKTKDYDEFNKTSVKKYQNHNPRELIERWKFVIKVLDSEIDDIGLGRIKSKGELFDWLFDDSHYEEHLNKIKKIIGIRKLSVRVSKDLDSKYL